MNWTDTMTREEFIALKWQVCEHWLSNYQQVVAGKWDRLLPSKMSIDGENCAYCDVYAPAIAPSRAFDCHNCPVSRASGYTQCKGTPWVRVLRLSRIDVENRFSTWRMDMKKAVEKEYRFLVNIALDTTNEPGE